MHGRVGQAEQGRAGRQGNAGIALQVSASRTDRPGMQGRAVQASLAVRAKYASHVGRACEAGKAVEISKQHGRAGRPCKAW